MVPVAVSIQRAKTTSIIVLAIATLVAAIWLVPRRARTTELPPHPQFAQPPPGNDPCAVSMTSRLTSTAIMAGERDDHLVVSLRAPNCGTNAVRPPMSIAIVLDRSSSMAPENIATADQPLTHAKRAVMELVDRLEPTDAFSIVVYAEDAVVLTPMQLASPDAKLAARRAVAQVEGMDGTNIGAGLDLGNAQVARSPVRDGIRRIELVSDGNANAGVYDQDGLSRIAATIAQGGTSITSVGLGLQYSEAKMTAIAAAGRGNYYFVADSGELPQIFTAELGSVGTIVAADAELEIVPGDNLEIVEVFSYGARQDGSGWIIPVADLTAGDTRKIVARVRVKTARAGAIELATAHLVYRPTDAHQRREVTTVARAEVTDDANVVRAGVDTGTVQLVEEAETARAIDEASAAYKVGGADAAGKVLDGRIAQAHANAAAYDAPEAADASVKAAEAVKRDFATKPAAQAVKAAGATSYHMMQ